MCLENHPVVKLSRSCQSNLNKCNCTTTLTRKNPLIESELSLFTSNNASKCIIEKSIFGIFKHKTMNTAIAISESTIIYIVIDDYDIDIDKILLDLDYM